MVRIRKFEQVALQQYQKPGRMGGFLHLYIGQESVAVGTVSLTVHWVPVGIPPMVSDSPALTVTKPGPE